MTRPLFWLLMAQFCSAFADNAILFAVIAMVLKTSDMPSWYVPALQSVFLIAYVILSPWVGELADRFAKSRVLIVANLLKASGAGLLLFDVEPLFAYGIVGAGAALYSPAKYGILPELASEHDLIKANSWIEGTTILAILTGMVVGAKVADHSVTLALNGTVGLFGISALISLLLPAIRKQHLPQASGLKTFYRDMLLFSKHPRARFAISSATLFWSAAACVRVILVAWAPLVLASHTASDIANLSVFLAIGIVIGAGLAPWLIPMHHLRKTRFPALMMGALIAGLGFCNSVALAQTTLFLMGCAGGLFIVPVNATLQTLGQHTIGSGRAVALQNFCQNVGMVISVAGYTFAASMAVTPVHALWGMGVILLILIGTLSLSLPSGDKGLDHGPDTSRR